MTDARHSDVNVGRLRAVFLQEAAEALAAMEQALLLLEENPRAAEPLHEVFRYAHTIKGGAAMVEFDAVADVAHRFEDQLQRMREGKVAVDRGVVTGMLGIVDQLRALLAGDRPGDHGDDRGNDTGDDRDTLTGDATAAITNAALADARGARSLRVGMEKLDAMLTLSGEIAVANARLTQVLGDDAGDATLAAAEELQRLLVTLHERVMAMRLVPIGPLFRQHQRTVRDVAANQGKLLKLVMEGEDVEVDATIVEQLREPLTHLVRNAVDHGLESPSRRQSAGKDPSGTIELRARHERGTVIIEVKDDGQGMKRERILAKARERGLVGDNEALTDSQVFALTMAPGLSTAEQVTEISGRGVGMDAVRRNIEAMRGSIEIQSAEGAGTTVRLRLPLTVAIIDGFVVGVGDERYVIPISAVTECLSAHDTTPDAPSGVLKVRGEPLPYVRLRRVFGKTDWGMPIRSTRESIVVVESDGRSVGLVVDHLIGETQAVIKPLATLFNDVRGVSGTTIMGDGRVSLILDIAPLMELAAKAA